MHAASLKLSLMHDVITISLLTKTLLIKMSMFILMNWVLSIKLQPSGYPPTSHMTTSNRKVQQEDQLLAHTKTVAH